MKTQDKFNKLTKSFRKSANRILRKTSNKDFTEIFNPNKMVLKVVANQDNKILVLSSEDQLRHLLRDSIVEALREVEYCKGSQKWNGTNTIGFIEEMLRYELNKPNKLELEEISKMYNLPLNKVKASMSIILTNFNRGVDTHKIKSYFSEYEFFNYKYKNNLEKMQKDFEEGKMTEQEIEIYKNNCNL